MQSSAVCQQAEWLFCRCCKFQFGPKPCCAPDSEGLTNNGTAAEVIANQHTHIGITDHAYASEFSDKSVTGTDVFTSPVAATRTSSNVFAFMGTTDKVTPSDVFALTVMYLHHLILTNVTLPQLMHLHSGFMKNPKPTEMPTHHWQLTVWEIYPVTNALILCQLVRS